MYPIVLAGIKPPVELSLSQIRAVQFTSKKVLLLISYITQVGGGVELGVKVGVGVDVLVGVGVICVGVILGVCVGVGVFGVAVGVKPGQAVPVGVIVGVIDGVKLIVGLILGVGVGVYLNAITYKYQFLTTYSIICYGKYRYISIRETRLDASKTDTIKNGK